MHLERRRIGQEPRSDEPVVQPVKPRPPDAPDGTWRMFQKDVDRVQEFRKCIECFLCQDVCHILRDHRLHDGFIGPRFLTYAAALEMHPFDVKDCVPRIEGAGRHWLLQHHAMLHEGLSEHITITENAIIPLKERVVDRFYDPMTRLLGSFDASGNPCYAQALSTDAVLAALAKAERTGS